MAEHRTSPTESATPINPAVYELLALANPWLEAPSRFLVDSRRRVPGGYIDRSLDRRPDWPVDGKANLLVGARQVGKSTLLWNLLRARKTPPLLINAEEPLLQSWSRSPTRALADLRGLLRPDMAVFVEGAQHLPDAGLFLKGLIDGGLAAPLLVTGSSSYHLLSRTRESLAGRAARARLHPLSLAEVAGPVADAPSAVRAMRVRRLALRHAVVGGYPEAWLADEPGLVLRGLVEAFVLRDATDLFRVQHLDAFRRLLHLVAGQAGSLVNISEWASVCEVSRQTVASYVDILGETGVLLRVPPFVGGRRAELTGRVKVYFADAGLRNAILRRLDPFELRDDRGPCLETWVAGELVRQLSDLLPGEALRYWRSRSGAEVDFVVDGPDGLFAWEVKAAALKTPRLSRSARSFIDAYAPRQFTVLNTALYADQLMGNTQVRWRPPEALADGGSPAA